MDSVFFNQAVDFDLAVSHASGHVVIINGTYYSSADEGLLPRRTILIFTYKRLRSNCKALDLTLTIDFYKFLKLIFLEENIF